MDSTARSCEYCDATFFVGGRGQPKRKTRFCSRQHSAAWRSAHYVRPEREHRDDKDCPKCNAVKPLTEFPKDASRIDGLYPYCLQCSSQRALANHGVLMRTEAGRAKKRHYAWLTVLKTYGLTETEYESMLRSQNGVCAICFRAETLRNRDGVRPLAVDHDHGTGKVRGLLCHACNIALGLLRDDPEFVLSAARYLLENGVLSG